MKQPDPGTKEYDDQVSQIFVKFTKLGLLETELHDFLLNFYIVDMSYNRGAICDAETKIKKFLKQTLK